MTGPAPVLDGWFTTGERPHLIGTRCTACGTYYFPPLATLCRNPDCDGTDFESVELSRTGTLWSFTNAGYQPPAPYVSPDPFRPYAIAAVELERERMIVLGQVVEGADVDMLRVGMAMELAVEPILDAAAADGKLVWKWKPMERAQ